MYSFTMHVCEKRNMHLSYVFPLTNTKKLTQNKNVETSLHLAPTTINSCLQSIVLLSHKMVKKGWTFCLERNQPDIYIEANSS